MYNSIVIEKCRLTSILCVIGGLDADMRDWGMLSEGNGKKKVITKEEKALSEFKAWDSNKQLLGKKKCNKSFKSKSKHKRR